MLTLRHHDRHHSWGRRSLTYFLRCECRFHVQTKSVETLPKWNFDGSSTGQAPGDDSEVVLRPCRIFRDPFRPRDDGLDNILVMCDTYTPAGEPLPSNARAVGKSCASTIFALLKVILCRRSFVLYF